MKKNFIKKVLTLVTCITVSTSTILTSASSLIVNAKENAVTYSATCNKELVAKTMVGPNTVRQTSLNGDKIRASAASNASTNQGANATRNASQIKKYGIPAGYTLYQCYNCGSTRLEAGFRGEKYSISNRNDVCKACDTWTGFIAVGSNTTEGIAYCQQLDGQQYQSQSQAGLNGTPSEQSWAFLVQCGLISSATTTTTVQHGTISIGDVITVPYHYTPYAGAPAHAPKYECYAILKNGVPVFRPVGMDSVLSYRTARYLTEYTNVNMTNEQMIEACTYNGIEFPPSKETTWLCMISDAYQTDFCRALALEFYEGHNKNHFQICFVYNGAIAIGYGASVSVYGTIDRFKKMSLFGGKECYVNYVD